MKRILPDGAQQSFLEFARRQTRSLRAGDKTPQSLDEWEATKRTIRKRLSAAYGEFPEVACDLEPNGIGVVERPGYRIERLTYQTRPGVWVTANAYVPTNVSGRVPAVLSVHGHWAWARVDPTPHARAVGLVKLGFFVLAVDAFGAGERAIKPAPGTYHGALLGASTWPVGTPLIGLQIYDNMRAVDYLIGRKEVDGDKLAITGASGGGNQSMNSGAWDERLKAVIPVCSVGTYDAYLGAACCVCEAMPGGLKIAEEGAILGLVAPRSLMVINATKDAFQFSVGEATKSIERAKPIFSLYGVTDRIRHVIVDSGHDYNKAMREAMYGWLAKSLRGEGDGSPIAEPELQIEDVQTIRCFPENNRPASFQVMPTIVHELATKKLAKLSMPDHREWWESDAMGIRDRLENVILGGLPHASKVEVTQVSREDTADGTLESIVMYPEAQMPVPGLFARPRGARGRLPTVLLVDPSGKQVAFENGTVASLLKLNWQVFAIDVRATGETAVKNDQIGEVPDHNSSEWALWMGRPLLGQWCWDILSANSYLTDRDDVEARRISVLGIGAGGLAAVCAAALDQQISSVIALRTLASLTSPEPFAKQRMANFVPFLFDVGDVPRLAALVAPRRVILAGSVDHQDQPLDDANLEKAWQFTKQIYGYYGANNRISTTRSTTVAELVGML